MDKKKTLGLAVFLTASALTAAKLIEIILGADGWAGPMWETGTAWKFVLYIAITAHITITAMSLSFHRQHTHQGVKLSAWIDYPMQVWLWMITSMTKLDWVSVHIYHHAHSDTDKDPHSPAHKGFWRIFLLGAFDYTNAKSHPEVLKIRARLPETRFEKFMSDNAFLAPMVFTVILMLVFGPKWGGICAVTNMLLSPFFAVGGVNALAHYLGYKNYKTTDNSRNVGFLLPLNWIVCGELDHNNHHRYPKSCSFRHRWWEVDVGYVYLWCLSRLRLAKIEFIHSPR